MKGLTLIELLVTVSILLAVFAIATPVYNYYNYRHDLMHATEEVVSSTRLSQARAMSGYKGSAQGVHFSNNSYTLFYGDVYEPGNPENESYSLPAKINIVDINFAGNTEVYFDKYSGNATPGTLKITTGDETYIITISESAVDSTKLQ